MCQSLLELPAAAAAAATVAVVVAAELDILVRSDPARSRNRHDGSLATILAQGLDPNDENITSIKTRAFRTSNKASDAKDGS